MKQDVLRQQIEFLRFFLVAGLVMLHYGTFPESGLSPFRGWQPSAYAAATFVNSFVLFFFLSAVPLLAAMSGWLFFKNFTNGLHFYRDRIRARSRSILLPMVLWNLLVLVGFAAVALVAPDQGIVSMVAYDVTDLTFKTTANALFGITEHPINFQFWFLRDLFLTILLTPLLGLALTFSPMAGACALAGIWLSGFDLWIFFRADVLFFFYIGGLLQIKRVPIMHPATKAGFALFALFIALVAARTIGPHFIPETSAAGVVLFEYGSRLMRAVGVVALWLIAPAIVLTAPGRLMAQLGSFAFFLHAFHWPANQVIKQVLARLFPPDGDAGMLVNYFATGLLTIVCAILVAKAAMWLCFPLYDILSGGRARTAPPRRAAVPMGQTDG